jgi:dTDP-4-amino-4,6-dideoxygalactose transaminase
MAIANKHDLLVIEDAAQATLASYKGRPLGSIGHMAALSFHETKNIISGEGGALLCRDAELGERAEIIREKGTNRSRFFRGQVDKYTWVDLGSSFLPGEITAAFLAAQIEDADSITARRLAIWDRYHAWAAAHEREGRLRRPVVPAHCTHNAHMYYLLLPSLEQRTAFIGALKQAGIGAVFHYIPLHSSPGGERFGRAHGALPVTDGVSDRLVRLPLWIGVEEHLDRIMATMDEALARAPTALAG